MKKRLIAVTFILGFSLSVPAMASVIPQDYSWNDGGMTQWESDRYFFELNYPTQIEMYKQNIKEEESKLAKAMAEITEADAQLALAVTAEEKEEWTEEKAEAVQDAELAKRGILLLMAEIEKTDLDKVHFDQKTDLEFLPVPAFDSGQYQPQADFLLKEEYIRPTDGVETSPFGWRIHPITGLRRLHQGFDLANWEGTPILAAKSGVVEFVGYNDVSGNNILIRHFDGQETAYFHMIKTIAKQGQVVNQGEQIGKMGTTGGSTGNHLHFEIRINKTAVDPAPYVHYNYREERR